MKKVLPLLCFVIGGACSAFAQPANVYKWSNYTFADQVTDVLEDGADLLVATRGGLLRLDATLATTSVLNKANTNLPSNMIEGLAKTSAGGIWVGTYDAGVVLLNNSESTAHYTSSNSALPGNTVYRFVAGRNNTVFAATSGGMAEISISGIRDLSMPSGLVWGAKITTTDTMGNLYCAAFGSVYKLTPNGWVDALAGININPVNITGLTTNAAGDLYILTPTEIFNPNASGVNQWISNDTTLPGRGQFSAITTSPIGEVYATRGNDVLKLIGSTLQVVAINVSGFSTINFIEVTDSSIYVAENGLLKRFRNTGVATIPTSNSTLTSNTIKAISTYHNGVTLVVDGKNHIQQKFGSNWKDLSISTPWTASAQVISVKRMPDGTPIAAVYGQGLYNFNGTAWALLANSFTGLQSENISAIEIDPTGRIWIATTDAGLLRFSGGLCTEIANTTKGLASNNILHMALSSLGAFAVNDALELIEISGPNTLVYNLAALGVNNSNITSLAVNANGQCYFAVPNAGVCKYRMGMPLEWYTSPTTFNGKQVSVLAFDSQNRLWAGSPTNGLGLWNNDTKGWEQFTYQNSGLGSNAITGIGMGVDGVVYVGTRPEIGGNGLISNGGLSVFLAGKAASIFDGPGKNLEISLNAFPNPIKSGSSFRLIANTPDGSHKVTVRIADMQGRCVATHEVIITNGLETQSIALPSISAGIYTMQLISATFSGATLVAVE